MVRVLFVGALLIFGTQELGAQITTYVAPPRPPAPAAQAVATADSIRRDSAQTASITNMQAWVDSAAGVSVPPTVGTDSSALLPEPRPVVTTFSDGSVAPATASDLPSLLIFGAVALILGAGILAGRPRG